MAWSRTAASSGACDGAASGSGGASRAPASGESRSGAPIASILAARADVDMGCPDGACPPPVHQRSMSSCTVIQC